MKKELCSNESARLLLLGGAGLLLTAAAHAQKIDDNNSPPPPRPLDRDRLAKAIIDEINIARVHSKAVSDSIEQQRSAYITQRTKQIAKPDSEKVAAESIDTCLTDLRIYVGSGGLSELKVAPKGMTYAQKCCDEMPDDKKVIWFDMAKGWGSQGGRRSLEEIRANGSPWRELLVPIPTYVPKPERGWADEVDIARRLVLDNLIDWDHYTASIQEMRFFNRQVLLDFRCKIDVTKKFKDMKREWKYIGVGVGKTAVRIQLGV